MKNVKAIPTIIIDVEHNLNQWLANMTTKDHDEVLRSISAGLKGARVVIRQFDSKFPYPGVGNFATNGGDIILNNKTDGAPLPNEYVFPRFPKDKQALMLHNAAKASGAQLFVSLNTYSCDFDITSDRKPSCINLPFIGDGKWIVRPNNGARSIGQVIIDADVVPFNKAIHSISEKLFSGDEQPIEGVTVYCGNEFVSNESFNQLAQGFFIQQVQPDIIDEYRIIVGMGGDVDLIMKRPRGEVGKGTVKYSCVNSNDDYTVWDTASTHSPQSVFNKSEVYTEFVAMVKALGIENNSFDLFETTVDGKIQWGVFEFCNQFSMSDLDNSTANRLMRKWFKDLLQKHFSKN